MLDNPTALHLANRLGFGPAQGSLAHIGGLGFDGYVDEQLNPKTNQLPDALQSALHAIPSYGKDTPTLYRDFWWRVQMQNPGKPTREERRMLKPITNQVPDQSRTARLMRAIASPWQLQETMVEFWFNHFNVYEKKQACRIWTGAYEDEAIRPHTLGRFSDLLLATARHPAMLVYLDNARNVAPVPGGTTDNPRRKLTGINENFAREVMELHTLGVDGGYTQADVTALAYILTGWTVGGDRETGEPIKGGFHFAVARHDPSPQTLLGRRFSGGEEEGQAALLMLAHHPSTARHISFKLAQYFVADQPPAQLVSAMAQEFQKTDGDLRAVMRTMLSSKEFRDPAGFGKKFKTPYQYVVSSARATGHDFHDVQGLIATLRQLGQPLYGCVTPDGYACTQSAWLDPDAMMRRISFAVSFGNGAYSGQGNATPADGGRLLETIGPELSAATRAALAKTSKPLWAGAILGSPDFMRC